MCSQTLPLVCPLCASQHTHFYHQDKRRRYWHCLNCELVFVEPEYLLSRAQEREIYELHENDPSDEGYRRFLQRAVTPLAKHLTAVHNSALDYGCGPAPTLAILLAELGLTVDNYDPLFAPNRAALQRQYDVVTCTEVVEHFHTPQRDWQQLTQRLQPGGLLVVMTKRVLDAEAFSRWHYKNDPTHVCFYHDNTFAYLAESLGWSMELADKDVVIMKRPLHDSGK